MHEPGLEDALHFAHQLLSKASDRLGRYRSHKVKDHAYFSDIDFELLEKKMIKAPYIPKISHAADPSHFDVKTDDHEKIEPYTGSVDLFRDF